MDVPAEPLETDCTEVGGLPAIEGLALERDPTKAAALAKRVSSVLFICHLFLCGLMALHGGGAD